MTKEEAKKLVLLCRTAFPNSYKDLSLQDIEYKIILYSKLYINESYEEVSNAYMNLIRNKSTKGFEPDVADVIAFINEARNPKLLTGASAWSLVRKAITCYEYKRNYDALPKCIQDVLGDAETLNAWGLVDEQYLETTVSKNFIIAFDSKQKRERDTGTFDANKYALPVEKHVALPPSSQEIAMKMIEAKGYDNLPDEYAEIGKNYLRSELGIE